MSATFNIRENKFISTLAAAGLVIATFSILPISLVGIEKHNKNFAYTKVYSLPKSVQKQELANRANNALKTPPLRAEIPTENISKMSVDFSQVGELNANLSIGAAEIGERIFQEGAADSSLFANAAFELSELDSVPKLLKGAKIKYPQKLYRRGIEGEVRLSVEINKNGRVEVLGVESSTDELFTKSALQSVGDFLYETPQKNGKPVRAKFILPIPFKISEL